MPENTLKPLIFATVLLPMLALASEEFAALQKSADPTGGLSSFLERYVGDCDPLETDCLANAKKFRQKAAGRRYSLLIGEDQATMISLESLDEDSGDLVLNVIPFFSGGGYGLSHGAPKRTDANGNPVMPMIRLKGKAPEGWNAARMARAIQARELKLHVLFSPQGTWKLPKKGGGKIQGVTSKVEGLLITHGRTGETLAAWPGP